MTTQRSPMYQQSATITEESVDTETPAEDILDPQDSTPECSGEHPNPPVLDDVFEILKNPRRRQVLLYLHSQQSTAAVGDLADQIGGWENDKEPRLLTSKERKRVYVSLYQSHLPKMADVGAISYNKARGTVETGPYLQSFLEYLPEPDEPTDSIADRCHRGVRQCQEILRRVIAAHSDR